MFEASGLQARERAEIDRRLARLDVSAPRGPWTHRLLEAVRRRPGATAQELSQQEGRPVSRIKSDVWKVRELGLVEGGAGGYRLSAKGLAYLATPP